MKILLSLFYFMVFICSLSCKTPSQKPSQIFASGQLPNLLETLVAPPLPDTIKENPHLLDVAIVDEGVDYFHPKLQPQIHFTHDPKTGKIIGAGRNFLSENNWAGTVLIDALPFAFGAKEISADGQIVEPLEDPLKTLDELNTIFMDRLVDKIKKEEDLKGTLFAQKIDHNSLSLMGAVLFVSDYGVPHYKQICKKNTADLKKSSDFILTKKNRDDVKIRKKLVELNISLLSANIDGVLRNIFDNPWSMGIDTGVPNAYSSQAFPSIYRHLEGFCPFYQITKKELSSFDQTFKIVDKIKTMVSYQKYRGDETSKNIIARDVIKQLQKAWYQHHFQSNESNLVGFIKAFCDNLSKKEWIKLQKYQKVDDAKVFLKKRLNLLFEYDQASKPFSSSALDQHRIKKNEQSFSKELSFIDSFIESGYEQDLLCKHTQPFQLTHQSEKEFIEKYRNIYYSSNNSNVSHGTHVAGIVATQDPNIGIMPIRVLTSLPENEKLHKELQDDFTYKFIEWTKKNIIKEMVSDLLGIKDPLLVEDKLRESINLYYRGNNMDHLFFKELEESIQYIGEHKIKLANMSLGTTFSRDLIPSISNKEYRDDLIDQNNYNFLTYEYLKYHLAMTIKTKAPGTLFVVAAGNNGQWLNSVSRSGLPCDLSSIKLEEYFSKEKKSSLRDLPNYKLNQILCVGSIGPKDDLSPYTNILLTDIPFVFSYGESILSYFKQGSCDASDKSFKALYGPFASFQTNNHSISSKQPMTFFKAKNSNDWRYKEQYASFRQISGIRDFLHKAMEDNYCHHRPYTVGEMSGTSMAAPAVTGYLAKNVITKMQQEGLSDEQIYLHPSYAPLELINFLLEKSPKYRKGLLKDVCKVIDIKKVDHPAEQLSLPLCR